MRGEGFRLTIIIVLLSLIRPDGSIAGDSFGETDTRFSYILIQALTLLGRLSELDSLMLVQPGQGEPRSARDTVLENIQRSMNFDGGFGTEPGAESHGGQGEFSWPRDGVADIQSMTS